MIPTSITSSTATSNLDLNSTQTPQAICYNPSVFNQDLDPVEVTVFTDTSSPQNNVQTPLDLDQPSGTSTPEVRDLLAQAMLQIEKNNKLFSEQEINSLFNGGLVSPSLEEFFSI